MSSDKKISQFDPGLVLKDAHERDNSSLRVTSANTSVPADYSRVTLTYNAAGSVTNAKFYKGTRAEIRHITFKADVSGSLNNTYFLLYSENDESLYHVWYNVNGAGVDPAPASSQGIEVELETNDSANVVKLATQLALQKVREFEIEVLGSDKLKILNARKGIATDTTDSGTGFIIDLIQDGAEEFIKSIDIPFTNGVRYIFNEQEKRFTTQGGVDSNGNLEVQLTRQDNDPAAGNIHDSVRIGNNTVEVGYTDLGDGTGEAKTQARTHVQEDTGNSTNIALLDTQQFTGTWTQRQNPEMIMASYSDQNFTYKAEFAVSLADAVANNIDSTISYNYVAGAINVPRRLLIAREYYRIIIINDSGIDMTELRFQTSIGDFEPLASRLNSDLALDADADITKSIIAGINPNNEYINVPSTRLGALYTSIRDQESGDGVFVSPGGTIKAEGIKNLAGGPINNFVLSTDQWDTVIVGSGTDTPGIGEHLFSTGITANSAVYIRSKNVARFIPANYNTFHGAIQLNTQNNVDNRMEWGAYDAGSGTENGVTFLIESGLWYVCTWKNGVRTTIPENQWNGPGALVLNKSLTANVYEIIYNAGTARYYQNNNLLHTTNLTNDPFANAIDFKTGLCNENYNGQTIDYTLRSRAIAVYTQGVGKSLALPIFVSGATAGRQIKQGPGTLEELILERSGAAGGVATVDVYDNATTAANPISRISLSGNDTRPVPFGTEGVTFNDGLRIVISNSGGGSVSCTVVFS